MSTKNSSAGVVHYLVVAQSVRKEIEEKNENPLREEKTTTNKFDGKKERNETSHSHLVFIFTGEFIEREEEENTA